MNCSRQNRKLNGDGAPSHWRRGLSLIELVIAIGLAGMIFATAISVYGGGNKGKEIKKLADEVENLGARAHMMALLHQRPYWLSISKNEVILRGATLQKVKVGEEGIEAELGEERQRVRDIESLSLNGIKVLVKRWSKNKWVEPVKKEELVWRFSGSGLCEPLSLRLEKGESWIELKMDPLTGRVEDRTSEIY